MAPFSLKHYSLSSTTMAVKAGDVSSDNGAVFKSGGTFRS